MGKDLFTQHSNRIVISSPLSAKFIILNSRLASKSDAYSWNAGAGRRLGFIMISFLFHQSVLFNPIKELLKSPNFDSRR
jgi:hypothetical protein